jgi:phytoene dehydrogenase-like protein
MKNMFDMIVIGSGLGGLTAGSLAAKRGKKILVLEKHSVVGGYAQNFRRGEFIFDVSLHAIGGIRSSGFSGILKELEIEKKIDFLPQKNLFRTILPNIDITLPSGNSEAIQKILIEHFPKERFGIRAFFVALRQILHEDRIFFSKWRWLSVLFGPITMPITILSEFLSTETVLRLFFRDKTLKAIISQLWEYFGLPPERLQAQYFLPPMSGFFIDGAYSIRGGSQNLSNALRDIIIKKGSIKRPICIKSENSIDRRTVKRGKISCNKNFSI